MTGGAAGAGVPDFEPGQAGGQFGSAGPGPGGGGGGVIGQDGAGGGGGVGYFGGGGGASEHRGAGGGGGSDYCAATITGCTISSGAGTQTMAGSGTGFAQVTNDLASDLAATLVSDSTGKGPGKALASKATAIQAAVSAGNKATACADITDYLGLVRAQTGKKLTSADAALLTMDATNLATALGC